MGWKNWKVSFIIHLIRFFQSHFVFLFQRFLKSLRGHVKSVYQVSWSADNRLLASSSADSTLKVWDIAKGSLQTDLPGHADEVYALDWSPDGERVASGGKDRVLKLWRK